MRILKLILFCSIFSTCTLAQDSLVLYKSITASGLDKASQDSYGNLYISDKKGNINKYINSIDYILGVQIPTTKLNLKFLEKGQLK